MSGWVKGIGPLGEQVSGGRISALVEGGLKSIGGSQGCPSEKQHIWQQCWRASVGHPRPNDHHHGSSAK